MRIRPRFRLRTLLVLTTLAAAACYWWVIRPTTIAQQLVSALQRTDYEAADDLFADSTTTVFEAVAQKVPPDSEWRWEVTLLPRTTRDLLLGRRQITVSLVRENTTFHAFPTIFATSTRVLPDPSSQFLYLIPPVNQ